MRETKFARRNEKIVRARESTTIVSEKLDTRDSGSAKLAGITVIARGRIVEAVDQKAGECVEYSVSTIKEKRRCVVGARLSKGADITARHVVEGSRNRALAGSG